MTTDFHEDSRYGSGRTTLECRAEVISDCSVVHVRGEVDLATVRTFNEALETALAVPHPIIVDFGETRYMDSTGIHALLVVKQRHHTTVAAAALTPTLKKIFELTGIDDTIPVYYSLDAALAALCTPCASGGGALA